MTINGPFGEFHASSRPQQIIGIAGGIGITPFRALAYEIAHGHLPHKKLTLIYSARGDYTYQSELDQWQADTDRFTVIYTRTAEAVNQVIDQQITLCNKQADVYISGSPGMIAAIRQSCREKGISKIVNDPFKGY